MTEKSQEEEEVGEGSCDDGKLQSSCCHVFMIDVTERKFIWRRKRGRARHSVLDIMKMNLRESHTHKSHCSLSLGNELFIEGTGTASKQMIILQTLFLFSRQKFAQRICTFFPFLLLASCSCLSWTWEYVCKVHFNQATPSSSHHHHHHRLPFLSPVFCFPFTSCVFLTFNLSISSFHPSSCHPFEQNPVSCATNNSDAYLDC